MLPGVDFESLLELCGCFLDHLICLWALLEVCELQERPSPPYDGLCPPAVKLYYLELESKTCSSLRDCTMISLLLRS